MTVFSPQHLVWLGVTILFVAGCVGMRRIPLDSRGHRTLRISLFGGVLLNESWWFVYRCTVGGVAVVDNLPLHLCDISAFVMLITLASGNRRLAELSYYAGVTGALLAVAIPAVSETGSIRNIAIARYFVTHIALVGVGFYFTFGRGYHPRFGAVVRSYLCVHLYALVITPVNLLLGTNYFFTLSAPNVEFFHHCPHWIFLMVTSMAFLTSFVVMHLPFVWLGRRQLGQLDPNLRSIPES
tara:strand:+ start:337 stop:1056 length:720 start_codon:yes stop_codon:yes gene_type:complete